MFTSIRGRIIVIIAVLIFAGGYLVTTYQESCGPEELDCTPTPVKLGLDLQGGMHLVLEVDDPEGTLTEEAKAGLIEQAEFVIRSRIDEFGVEEPLIQRVGTQRLIVELPGVRDQERAKDIIRQSAFLEWKLVLPISELQSSLGRIDRAIITALGPDSIRNLGRDVETEAPGQDIEELLFGGDTAAQQDTDTTEVASADTAAADTVEAPNLRPFTALLNQGDVEGAYLVAEEDAELAMRFLEMPEVQRALPRNVALHWDQRPTAQGARNYRRLYVLQEDAFLTGDMLENATANRDPQYNQPIVQFELSRAGGRRFGDVTAQHIGDHIAIILDDEVVSAPVVRDRIGARGQIELGGSPLEEARDLALVLRAGALPAPLRIMEERSVGPSLGQDSIEQGELAGIVGIVLVVLIMAAYYKMAGVLAIGALLVYVVLVMGGLAALGAALSLPGIAGLILSVGMAVDANVLIFERIREELIAGRATRTAVDEGFAHALSAIVDANLTTLITALILFQFGTGPVQGFAVTLSIGIVASFFSALYVTRTFFLIYLRGKRASDPISI